MDFIELITSISNDLMQKEPDFSLVKSLIGNDDNKEKSKEILSNKLKLKELAEKLNACWIAVNLKRGSEKAVDIASYHTPYEGEKEIIEKSYRFLFSPAFLSKGFADPLDKILYSQKINSKRVLRLDKIANTNNTEGAILFSNNTNISLSSIFDIQHVNDVIEKIKRQFLGEINDEDIADALYVLTKEYTTYNNLDLAKECIKKIYEELKFTLPNNNLLKDLAEELISAYIWNQLNSQKWKYIYYFAEHVAEDTPYASGICIGTERLLTKNEVDAICLLIDRIFGTFYYIMHSYDLQISAIKSAIGSIMSRNGSHNIGSHVLAALSHNVGTMPDDRIMYQYIQHRMDYIATATTDQPTWKQPTLFVSSLMKEFLQQKHLLDYISGSEGLHAYKFQGQSIEPNQEKTICFHIRKIDQSVQYRWDSGDGFIGDKTNVVNFIKYDSSEDIDFSKDVAIAIPGGIIGQHAFYTILENILRNAAKHEWAEAVRVWNIAKNLLGEDIKNYADCCPKCLDIYIDFFENRKNNKVEFRIWNNRAVPVDKLAKIGSAIIAHLFQVCQQTHEEENKEKYIADLAESFWKWYRFLIDNTDIETIDNLIFKCIKTAVATLDQNTSTYRCDAIIEIKKALPPLFNIDKNVIKEFLNIAIAAKMQAQKKELDNKIDLSFIDDQGKLRRENWGIAEMRISAGFLICCEIGQVGGLSESKKPHQIIFPVLVENGNNDFCLGYRFDIDKPKKLLVVLKSENQNLEKANLVATNFGITFISDNLLNIDNSYPYSYILFEELTEDRINELKSHKLALPFRILSYNDITRQDHNLSSFIPKFSGNFFAKIEDNINFISESTESSDAICYSLLEDVFADWLCHVRKGLTHGERLALDIDGNDEGGTAQALISKEELLKFVFTNTFNAAVRSFLKMNGPKDKADQIYDGPGFMPIQCGAILYAIAEMPYRQVLSLEELIKKYPSRENDFSVDLTAVVQCQLAYWIEEILKQNKTIKINDSSAVENWIFALSNEIQLDNYNDFIQNPENGFWLNRFVSYIISVILDQADSFLRKYEERFSTLPKYFKMKSGSGKEWIWEIGNDEIQNEHVVISSDADDRNRERNDNNAICYFRHGDAYLPTIADTYYEPLSGAQRMLNTFMTFREKISDAASSKEAHCWCADFVTRMVENASLRILIIDERVSKFMREHQNVNNFIGGLRLAVADDNDPNVITLFSNFTLDNPPKFSNVNLTDFEIIIIHQGIIDKLLRGHEDKAVVEVWLNKLINQLRLHYVVITTGRGAPSNIPDTARVLPYSVIENSILQRYPEKMILVDAVMNILPVRQKKNGVN